MLSQALLAGVELGLNRVLALDGCALPRLARLAGQVIAIDSQSPALSLFILADGEGLRLAPQWQGPVTCRLGAPASILLRLASADDKQALLHQPQVRLEGDSGVLLELAAILQDLQLDWEYELSRWLGPLATALLAGPLRRSANHAHNNLRSLGANLGDYLREEARVLVGQDEAQARFAELDALKLTLDRLDARIQRLAPRQKPPV
jgi:ubiquinone biosynthesis protein UbiJ